jgi:hypothetical protein
VNLFDPVAISSFPSDDLELSRLIEILTSALKVGIFMVTILSITFQYCRFYSGDAEAIEVVAPILLLPLGLIPIAIIESLLV